jgi:plasmid maintenance system antidote protein VapI
MDKKNENFVAALIYMKSHGIVTGQNDLAEKMRVSEDTITRAKQGKRITEDFIAKLMRATGDMFNVQFLRGESDVMLAADIRKDADLQQISAGVRQDNPTTLPQSENSSWADAVIAAKNETINSLKRELASKDETIKAKSETIASLELVNSDLRQRVAELEAQLALEKTKVGGYGLHAELVEEDIRRNPSVG